MGWWKGGGGGGRDKIKYKNETHKVKNRSPVLLVLEVLIGRFCVL